MSKITDRLNRIMAPTGRLMDVLGKACDYLLLGLLWLLCSVPVVTVGAATAALYSAGLGILRGEDTGVLRDFFGALRRHFKMATLLWLAALALGAFLILDLYFYFLWSAAGEWMGTILFSLFAAATMLYLCVMPWLFPYITQFEAPFRQAVKASAYLGLRNILYTLAILAVHAGLIVLGLFFPIAFLLAPGIAAAASSWCLERVFRRYRPKDSKPTDITD